jgi:hypothetical protein
MQETGFAKRLARAWFLLKRRWGQRYRDPRWLRATWARLLRDGGLEAHLPPTLASLAPDALAERVAREAENSFFFGTRDQAVFAQRYPGEFPDATRQILQEADDLCQGRIHYADAVVETEVPPRWYDTKAIAGMGKWHRIPAAFHWLKTLMQAFWLSGDKRYAQTATAWLESWLHCSHRFDHDIWKSTNFVGLRALNLLQGLIGFSAYWQRHPELLRQALAQLWLHGTLLERRVEYWGYNHLIWNAHDLTLLGIALQNIFKDAARWAKLGIQIMHREIPRQIAPDGVHVERSIHYQVFVSKLVGEWITTLWKSGQPLLPEVVWRWNQAIEMLSHLRYSERLLPLYGDGYRTADPNIEGTIEEISDFLLALHSWLQGVPDQARHPLLPWKIGCAYWLDPPHALCQMRGTSSGFATTRTQKAARELVLHYQAGNSLAGQVHAHADSLSFTLSDETGEILIDPGGYGEVADEWRTYFRSTYAHNTVVVNGENMSHLQGVYKLTPALHAALEGCWCWHGGCAWIGYHSNYQRLPARVHHWRTLLLTGTELFVVLDYLRGAQPFQVEQLFHFAEGQLEKEAEGTWLWTAKGRQWRLHLTCSVPAQQTLFHGSTVPLRGWSGERRGQPYPIPTLVHHAKGTRRYWLIAALARPECQLRLHLNAQIEGRPQVLVPGGTIVINHAAPHTYELSWRCDSQ